MLSVNTGLLVTFLFLLLLFIFYMFPLVPGREAVIERIEGKVDAILEMARASLTPHARDLLTYRRGKPLTLADVRE
jgi:hypothetical protein